MRLDTNQLQQFIKPVNSSKSLAEAIECKIIDAPNGQSDTNLVNASLVASVIQRLLEQLYGELRHSDDYDITYNRLRIKLYEVGALIDAISLQLAQHQGGAPDSSLLAAQSMGEALRNLIASLLEKIDGAELLQFKSTDGVLA